MKKLVSKILIIIIPSMVAFVVGWKVGALQGFAVEANQSFAEKTISLVQSLSAMRAQKYKELISIDEDQLDSLLYMRSLYLSENRGWIIYPYNRNYKNFLDDALTLSAEYRKRYPRPNIMMKGYKDVYEIRKHVDAMLARVKH